MKTFNLAVGASQLSFTFNDLASQADGSVIAQYGDTVVLATVMQSKTSKPDLPFFPLTVDYDERFYAGGKILGSRFVRREGRPSDEAVLTARMIDRTLRPLFSKDERRDTQIVITVLSFDRENDPDVLALLAASLALGTSRIPFYGQVGAIRLGKVNGKLVFNPTYQEREQSEYDIIVGGKRGLITMIEGEAKETKEEELVEVFQEGIAMCENIIDFQESIIKEFSPAKDEVVRQEENTALASVVKKFCSQKLAQGLYQKSDASVKESLRFLHEELKEEIARSFGGEYIGKAFVLFYEELERMLQTKILKEGLRPDGRKPDELRPIRCEVGLLKRTHGSGLFKRGLTHGLSVVTLGSPGEERWIEGMEIEERQRFMHHYNFPPFSVGEVAPLRGPSRREIGHGYLAQKALKPLLPSIEEFPYTIRVVTEILSSNGSTSMAATCASCLALMDAGVPIKKMVAGVAMGLVYESEDNFVVLTDIQGPEDQEGQMDCKVAGTSEGVTAIQLDTKLHGLPLEVLKRTLMQARKARLEILDVMAKTIDRPRDHLSEFAPCLLSLRIDPAKIRFVIGPGGETINDIIAKTGTKIDINQEGLVFITGKDELSATRAKEIVEAITRDIKEGDIIKGKVTKIADFGAFVSLSPSREGLIHISELADGYVKSVEDVVKLGQEVEVYVKGIDPQGKIRLSLKRSASPETSKSDHDSSPRGSRGRRESFNPSLTKKPSTYSNRSQGRQPHGGSRPSFKNR